VDKAEGDQFFAICANVLNGRASYSKLLET